MIFLLQALICRILYKRGGRNVKLICQGTKQCIFVMFSSPQPMFVIFLASPGDFPVTSGGGGEM